MEKSKWDRAYCLEKSTSKMSRIDYRKKFQPGELVKIKHKKIIFTTDDELKFVIGTFQEHDESLEPVNVVTLLNPRGTIEGIDEEHLERIG